GLVLLLACINFMNLSTASNEKRAKEIGVRKSIGSTRGQLIRRFMIESVIMSALALLLSLLLTLLALPFFNQLAGKQVAFPWNQAIFWVSAIVLMIVSGTIAGIYPAVYLSGFQAVTVLKGAFRDGASGAIARKMLVVVQFTISLSLGLGTLIVFKQIKYAQQRPIGYAVGRLITLHTDLPNGWDHYGAIKADLLQNGVAEDVAASHSPVTEIDANYIGFDWPGKDPGTEPWFGVVKVTPEFGRTVGWEIRDGRDFSDVYARDSLSIVLNEAAVGLMGFKKPVGQTVDFDD